MDLFLLPPPSLAYDCPLPSNVDPNLPANRKLGNLKIIRVDAVLWIILAAAVTTLESVEKSVNFCRNYFLLFDATVVTAEHCHPTLMTVSDNG